MELETFFEKFEVIAEAPGAVPRMRKLVLHWALMGKLTGSSDDAESANELLARSRAHMRGLMSEKRAKNEKPAEPFDGAEGLPPVPDRWVWTRLVDAGQFINGAAFKPADWEPSGRPIIRIQNLSGRNPEYNRTNRDVDDSIVVKDGDLLVSWSATLDAFVWRGEDAVLNQHIFRVIPSPLTDKGFLYWLLKHVIRQLADSDHAHGLVMSHINRKPFLAHPIAIPPLAEQKRIVAKVDSLMALCDQLQARQQERQTRHAALTRASLARFAEEPTSATLDPLFDSDLSISPEDLRETISMLACERRLCPQDAGGETTSLAHLVGKKSLKNGLSLRPSASVEKYACLPISSLRQGVIDLSIAKPTDLSNDRALPFLVEKGDVFVVRGSGSKHLVGQAGLVDEAPENLIFPDLFIRVPIPVDALDPRYFVLAWNSSAVRLQIADLAKTTSGIWKVNQTHVSVVEFPLPPLPEQRRIVVRVDRLMARVDELEARLASARDTARDLLDALVATMTKADEPANLAGQSSPSLPRLVDDDPDAQLARPGEAAGLFGQPDEEARRTTHAGLLATYLVKNSRGDRHHGRTKLEKQAHLVQYHAGVPIGRRPVRDRHGPVDHGLLLAAERFAGQRGAFVTDDPGDGSRVEYTPGPQIEAVAAEAEVWLGDSKPEVNRLLKLLKPLKTKQCEILATVYGAWNDLLIDDPDGDPTAAAIISQCRNHWHDSKKSIDSEQWQWAFAFLRESAIVPIGHGPRVAATGDR